MKQSFLLVVFCAFLLALLAMPALAQIPAKLAIQGRLTNSTGGLYNSTANFTFKIYDDVSAGNLLWTENWNASTACGAMSVQSGIFNALLGTCNNPGPNTLGSLYFNVPYWLELTVNGSLLSPRQPISSNAYGLRANITDFLNGTAAGNLNINSNQIYGITNANATTFYGAGTGLTGTASSLNVNSSNYWDALDTPASLTWTNCTAGNYAINISGTTLGCATPTITESDPKWTANQSAVYNETKWTGNYSSVFNETKWTGNSTNISRIGDCPAGQLVQNTTTSGVSCVAAGSGTITGGGTAGYVPMWNASTSLNNSGIYQNGSSVGIGTASPLEKLHVSKAGDIATTGIIRAIMPDLATDGREVNIALGKSIAAGGTALWGYRYDTTAGDEGMYFTMYGDSANSLFIRKGGNIGIGTTSPTQTLTVVGNINTTGSIITPTNISIGPSAGLAPGAVTIAIGNGTSTSGTNNVVIGNQATTGNNYDIAIGDYVTTNGAVAVAVGQQATAGGAYSTAIGSSANASGQNAGAFSTSAKASGIGSTAAGVSSTASGENSVALGNSVVTSATNSFAIGFGLTNNVADSFMVGEATTTLFVETNSTGYVGIGTTTPATGAGWGTSPTPKIVQLNGSNALLRVTGSSVDGGMQSNDNAFWLGTQSNHPVNIIANGILYMTISNASGNVSIGTSSMRQKLVVVGTGNFTAPLYIGNSTAYGTRTVYTCMTTSGSYLPIGALTTNTTSCATYRDTGLRIP